MNKGSFIRSLAPACVKPLVVGGNFYFYYFATILIAVGCMYELPLK